MQRVGKHCSIGILIRLWCHVSATQTAQQNCVGGHGCEFDFHRQTQPAVYLTELKLAFLDHVYAFEVKPKHKSVRKLPPHLAAYHWINVGVSDPDSNLNPLKLLLRTFERTT
jgi:hypothetical protein